MIQQVLLTGLYNVKKKYKTGIFRPKVRTYGVTTFVRLKLKSRQYLNLYIYNQILFEFCFVFKICQTYFIYEQHVYV